MNYKNEIIKLIRGIKNTSYLKMIYGFVTELNNKEKEEK